MTDATNDTTLSLQEAADELGVHYMTAYRYVRTGLLTAEKAGAAWQVRPEDLQAFQERDKPKRGRGSRTWEEWVDRFEDRLLAGDRKGSASVVDGVLAGGADLTDLYLEVVAPAQARIGERWAEGEIDVAVEHRASVLLMQLLGQVSVRFSRRGPSKGLVIMGAAPGERHSLPVTIVADLVRASGFEVDDLGADVPAASFAGAVARAHRLVCVGISVTSPGNEESLVGAIAAVKATSPVPVLVGGAAVDEETALAMGADHYAVDARQAIRIIGEF